MADEVARLVAVMEAQLRGFTKGMEEAQRIADRRFGQIERRMNQTEKLFGASFANIGGLARRYFSVVAITAFANSLINAADKLKDTSAQLGISTQELQQLDYAARATGATSEKIGQALSVLTDRLGDAAKGEGELAELMRDKNIALGDTMSVLRRLADLTKSAHTQQEKMNIATAAFGPSGRQLVSLLDQGAEGMKRLAEEANRKGQVWDPGTVERLDKAKSAIDDITRGLVTVAALPASVLLGQLADITNAITSGDMKAALQELVKVASLTIPGAAPVMAELRRLQAGGPKTSVQMELKPWDTIPGAPGSGLPPPKPGAATTAASALGTPNLTASELTALADDVFARRFEEWFRTEFPASRVMAPAFSLPGQVPIDTQELGELTPLFEEMGAATDELRNGLLSVGLAAAHGFGDMEDAASRALSRLGDMILELGVLRPLLNALLGESGGGGGLLGSLFAGLFANGGTIKHGQWGIVGERGPEAVFSTSAGARVVPRMPSIATPRAGRGGGSINISQTFSLDGAMGDQGVRMIARQAAAEGAAVAIRTAKASMPGWMIEAQKRVL